VRGPDLGPAAPIYRSELHAGCVAGVEWPIYRTVARKTRRNGSLTFDIAR
jgi:hypothetical protein